MIRLRLVDKLRALKHDDILERAAEVEKNKKEKEAAHRPFHVPEPSRPRSSPAGKKFRRAASTSELPSLPFRYAAMGPTNPQPSSSKPWERWLPTGSYSAIPQKRQTPSPPRTLLHPAYSGFHPCKFPPLRLKVLRRPPLHSLSHHSACSNQKRRTKERSTKNRSPSAAARPQKHQLQPLPGSFHRTRLKSLTPRLCSDQTTSRPLISHSHLPHLQISHNLPPPGPRPPP